MDSIETVYVGMAYKKVVTYDDPLYDPQTLWVGKNRMSGEEGFYDLINEPDSGFDGFDIWETIVS